MSSRLRDCLSWRLRFLAIAPVRTTPMSEVARKHHKTMHPGFHCSRLRPRRVLVYTDATGGGVLAFVMLLPCGRLSACASRAPGSHQRVLSLLRRILASTRAPNRLRKWPTQRKTQARRPVVLSGADSSAPRQVAAYALAAAVAAIHFAMSQVPDAEVRWLTFSRRSAQSNRRAVAIILRLTRRAWHAVAGTELQGRRPFPPRVS